MESKNQGFVDRASALIASGVESQVPMWSEHIDMLRNLSRSEHVRMGKAERSALNRYIHRAQIAADAIKTAETARQEFDIEGMMRRYKATGEAPTLYREPTDPGDIAEAWAADYAPGY